VNDEKTLDVILHSYLTNDSINVSARMIKKCCGNTRNGYQVVRQGTGELAETIISIAKNRKESRIVSSEEVISKKSLDDSLYPAKLFRRKCRCILVTYALDLLYNVALYTTAAKHLLQLGRVMDAISLCLMELETPYPFKIVRQSASSIPGIRAVDFFVACKNEAQRIDDPGLRIRLFYHLHSFLMRWDKESLSPSSTQDSNSINSTSTSHSHKQLSSEGSVNKTISNTPKTISALAEDYPEFPGYLFCQSEDTTSCSKIRQLFGYPEL
jgi:type III secretion system FlhB-like substrate exporter